MSCILSAPSSDSGKTTLALLISCWAYTKGLKLQPFKVGPDYLDQQQLSSIGLPICRNLDIFLSGEEWIKKTFYRYSSESELSLIEGAMGLYDGLGSTHYSSTANVAKVLNLPIIFIIDARGKVASLLPLLNGFKDLDNTISIKGVVFNNVNSKRHKDLIKEVFEEHEVEIIGFLPTDKKISLKKGNLGLISPSESENNLDVNYFSNYAEQNLDLSKLIKILTTSKRQIINTKENNKINVDYNKPIAIAEDKIFHFQYPETREFLNDLGVPVIPWNIFNDEEIPKEAFSVIIPGGFPEKYAEHISCSKKSLSSLKKFHNKGFIYAECGGMMILGDSIKDSNGITHKMSGILPFKTKKGKLTVGYRYIKGEINNSIIKKDQVFKGHEFHYWQIENNLSSLKIRQDLSFPWKIKSWGTNYQREGWASKKLHASWIHLHIPSNIETSKNFIETLQQ